MKRFILTSKKIDIILKWLDKNNILWFLLRGKLMKKTTLLNAPVSSVVAQLGHGDSICIGDAGLPVPSVVERIDLAVSPGVPSLLDVFYAVTTEMFVERIVVAKELQDQQPRLMDKLLAAIRVLESDQNSPITLGTVEHVDFKPKMIHCKAFIRTGECTPFANIIIYAGVTF
jgi:D-ribose pyranase